MYCVLDALQGGSSQLRRGSYRFGVRDERIVAAADQLGILRTLPTSVVH